MVKYTPIDIELTPQSYERLFSYFTKHHHAHLQSYTRPHSVLTITAVNLPPERTGVPLDILTNSMVSLRRISYCTCDSTS